MRKVKKSGLSEVCGFPYIWKSDISLRGLRWKREVGGRKRIARTEISVKRIEKIVNVQREKEDQRG